MQKNINGPCHAKTSLIPYANNKDADQPVHPRSLINTFVGHCLDSMICILAISKVSRFSLASVAEQAGLNVTWLKIPEDTFSLDVAHLEMLLAMNHLSSNTSPCFCSLTNNSLIKLFSPKFSIFLQLSLKRPSIEDNIQLSFF